MTLMSIDDVLRLAYLEGAIDLHGAYEHAVRRRAPESSRGSVSQSRLLTRLEQALAVSRVDHEVPATVGAFLQSFSRVIPGKEEELPRKLALTRNTYRMLEHDRISPLKIPLETWCRFMVFFRLPVKNLEAMMRRTHRLVFFQPSFRSTLARYGSGTRSKERMRMLDKATSELYARAGLPIPPVETERLEALFTSLRARARRRDAKGKRTM